MSKRFIVVVAPIAFVAATASASGFVRTFQAHRTSSAMVPVAYTRTSVTRSSGPVAPATALSTVTAAMGANDIASSHVGTPPAGPPTQSHPGRPWLYANVKIPSLDQGDPIYAIWEADVTEGALAELTGNSADMADDFGGSTFNGELPNGQVVSGIGGGMGDVARGQVFSSENPGQIKAEVETALAGLGLSLNSLRVFTPINDAVSVVASTDTPRSSAASLGDILRTVFGSPPRYEGSYFELRDSSTGRPIAIAAAAYRTGAGHFWISPAYSAVSDVPQGGRPSA